MQKTSSLQNIQHSLKYNYPDTEYKFSIHSLNELDSLIDGYSQQNESDIKNMTIEELYVALLKEKSKNEDIEVELALVKEDLKKQKKKSESRINELVEENSKLKAQLSHINQIMNENANKWETEKRGFEKQIAILNQKLDTFKTQYDSATFQIRKLETELNNCHAERDKLKTLITKLQTEIEVMRDQHSQKESVKFEYYENELAKLNELKKKLKKAEFEIQKLTFLNKEYSAELKSRRGKFTPPRVELSESATQTESINVQTIDQIITKRTAFEEKSPNKEKSSQPEFKDIPITSIELTPRTMQKQLPTVKISPFVSKPKIPKLHVTNLRYEESPSSLIRRRRSGFETNRLKSLVSKSDESIQKRRLELLQKLK